MNAPDPHHWTLKSCFGAFLSVWVHLEPFRYCTKLAAKHDKLVQLMHKFRPRRLVRIFCNERSRSTLLDPKLMFCCVSFCSSAFWTVSLLHEIGAKLAKLVQLMQKFMPRYRARIFHNERSQSTPLDPKLMFWCVSFRSGAFWNSFATARNLVQNAPNWCNCCKSSCYDFLLKFFTTNAPDPHHWTLNSFFGAFLSVSVHLEPFRYCTKLGAKWANLVQLMQEFVPQSLIRISRNGCSRSTQLDPN